MEKLLFITLTPAMEKLLLAAIVLMIILSLGIVIAFILMIRSRQRMLASFDEARATIDFLVVLARDNYEPISIEIINRTSLKILEDFGPKIIFNYETYINNLQFSQLAKILRDLESLISNEQKRNFMLRLLDKAAERIDVTRWAHLMVSSMVYEVDNKDIGTEEIKMINILRNFIINTNRHNPISFYSEINTRIQRISRNASEKKMSDLNKLLIFIKNNS